MSGLGQQPSRQINPARRVGQVQRLVDMPAPCTLDHPQMTPNGVAMRRLSRGWRQLAENFGEFDQNGRVGLAGLSDLVEGGVEQRGMVADLGQHAHTAVLIPIDRWRHRPRQHRIVRAVSTVTAR